MKQPLVTIVVPCYNEEEVIQHTAKTLTSTLVSLIKENLASSRSKILFVDDGSRDQTWPMISELSKRNSYVAGLKLTRNFGHQKALIAGLDKARHTSDCTISIDADLQDDVSAIREFLIKFFEGNDIVYGVRRSRKTDSFFKKTTAQGFYKMMKRMGVNLVYNHADFRLLSKRALNELFHYKESNLFLRGIISLIGLKSAKVYYDRKDRLAGESKYPLKKMLAFAFDGVTSFSIAPIRMITITGFLSFFISSLAGLYALIVKLTGGAASGWTSLIISIWFLGGLLLMSVGLIGEYIGKIYEETKRRPRFSIETDDYSAKMRPVKRPAVIENKRLKKG